MNKPGVSKWIVVTGAASGIGLATARTLLEAGMNVIALDRDAEKLDTAFEHQKASVITRQVDVTDAEHSRHVMNAVRSETGPLWGLVNAAGIFPVTPFISLELDEWDQVLNTNLRGAFIIAQWVAQAMIEDQITGAIINVTSTSATFCRPGVTHYGASKAGLTQLTRDMALELAEYGIRVNAVAPGPVWTPLNPSDANDISDFGSSTPMKRPAQPEEIAPAYVFLASSHCSSYITGEILPIIGGYSGG